MQSAYINPNECDGIFNEGTFGETAKLMGKMAMELECGELSKL
jgi:hypothetical protein